MNAAPARGRNGMAALPSLEQLEHAVPAIVATMRRYLQQVACILRPGSVVNTARRCERSPGSWSKPHLKRFRK